LLNLGHSFGHAIESEAGLGKILHGEAVALGICLAYRFSAEAGLSPQGDADRVVSHFSSCGLPTRLADAGIASGKRLIDWIARDKKSQQGRISLILARGIGRAFFEPAVERRRLLDFLERSA
jgi:3-dehydroquinate synthase